MRSGRRLDVLAAARPRRRRRYGGPRRWSRRRAVVVVGPRPFPRLLALLGGEVALEFQLLRVAAVEIKGLVKRSTSAGREQHVAPSRGQFRGRVALVIETSHDVFPVGLADAAKTPGGGPRAGRLVAPGAGPPSRELAPRPVPRRRIGRGRRRRRRARELFSGSRLARGRASSIPPRQALGAQATQTVRRR